MVASISASVKVVGKEKTSPMPLLFMAQVTMTSSGSLRSIIKVSMLLPFYRDPLHVTIEGILEVDRESGRGRDRDEWRVGRVVQQRRGDTRLPIKRRGEYDDAFFRAGERHGPGLHFARTGGVNRQHCNKGLSRSSRAGQRLAEGVIVRTRVRLDAAIRRVRVDR